MNRKHVALWALGLLLASGAAFAATTLTAETRGTVPMGATGGPTAGVTCDCRADMTDFSVNSSAAVIRTGAGNLTIDGTDDAYARVDNMHGQWTNISQVDTNGGEIVLSPGDKQLVRVSGSTDALDWQSASRTTLDDGTVDFAYAGSSPSVELGGMAPNTEVAAIDSDARFQILDTATTDAQGRATFDSLSSGTKEVRLRQKPETLFVRNEANRSQLVDGNATDPVEVSIRFYLGDDTESPSQVIERSTTDGKINMTGLPADESFVVVADAPGYLPRRIFVESLYQSESIYLLPESESHVEKVYALSDFTGLYPKSETVLKIQRAIGGEWETVQGDFFGATGTIEAQLRYNTRHRLVLLNTETNRQRVLGRVTPLASNTEEIEVNSREDIQLSEIGPIVYISPQVGTLPASETSVGVDVRAANADLTSWNYSLRYEDGGSTVLDQGQFSSASAVESSVNLTGMADGQVVLEVGWQTADGRSNVQTATYAVSEQYSNANSLLSVLPQFRTSLPASSQQAFGAIVSVLLSVLGAAAVALRVPISSESFGLLALGILGIFSVIGWISYAVIFAGGVAWVGMAAIRRGI